MMYYIESASTNPSYNLALEQYVFDHLDRSASYFMLWQNHNSIIVGKHQNTVAELNAAYVAEHDIQVVRRLSGGGAVYHDMGNLNFTFITDVVAGEAFDFSAFCSPVVSALRSLGVNAEIAGRNDMTIDGGKFSGNAQYIREGRVMHHGTLLFDSDLNILSQALRVPPDKYISKGATSVRSRVTNIRPHLNKDISLRAFWDVLRDYMMAESHIQPYRLTDADEAIVKALQATVYSQRSWNYGRSPDFSIQKQRRIEGCGRIEVHMDVSQDTIRRLAFYGDYFGNGDSSELVERLVGCKMEHDAVCQALENLSIGRYFNNLDLDSFVSVLLY